jgi:hypothetical protein
MKFKDFYRSLDRSDREDYAKRAGTTTNYIEIHLMASRPLRKIPRTPLMKALVDEARGACSLEDLLKHFYSIKAA